MYDYFAFSEIETLVFCLDTDENMWRIASKRGSDLSCAIMATLKWLHQIKTGRGEPLWLETKAKIQT